MSSGNMFMAVGAIIILSFLSMSINRSVLNSKDTSNKSEYYITAQGILQQLTEEIRNKPFDVAVVSNPEAAPSSFRSVESLAAIAQTNSGTVLTQQTLSTMEVSRLQNTTETQATISNNPISISTTASFPSIDSYNGTTLQYTTPRSGDYNANTSVVYVDPASPTTIASTATHAKRVTILVTNPYLKDTLRTSFVMSY